MVTRQPIVQIKIKIEIIKNNDTSKSDNENKNDNSQKDCANAASDNGKEVALMAADSININLGICMECNDLGPVGTSCVNCENKSGLVYVTIKEEMMCDTVEGDKATLVVDKNFFSSSTAKAYGTRNV